MKNKIEHTLVFNHSPEEVWDYLTKPELIAQWLMKSDFQPVVGHQFRFTTTPLPQYGFDGIVYCTVLEVRPFEKLSYTWKGGSEPGNVNLDSVVVWTLKPKDGGTELHLEHSGFKEEENPMMLLVMNEGWLRNMRHIDELIKARKNDTSSS